MNKEQLLKRLSEMIDEANRTALYGSVEIQFANGEPTVLRKNSTTKLNGGTTRYDPRCESR